MAEESCEHCGKRWSTNGNMNKHIRRFHNGGKLHNCNQCNRSFPQKYKLEMHSEVHTKGPYVCKVCNNGYSRKSNLQRHFKEVHKSGQENASNVISEKTDRRILKTHKREALQAEPTVLFPPNYNPTLQTNIITLQKPELFSCKECDYSSSKSNNVKLHLVQYHLKEQLLREHRSEGNNCRICSKKSLNEDAYAFHLVLDHGLYSPYILINGLEDKM